MEILFLTEFLSAIGGGGAIAFSGYARQMGRRGHSVHIICRKSTNDELGPREGSNVNIHRIDPEGNLRHGWFPGVIDQLFYIIHLVIEGARIMKTNKPDVIHGNTLSPAIAASILGLIYGIPVVTTFHHVAAVQMRRNQSTRWRGAMSHLIHTLFRRLVEKSILSLPFDCVHSVSLTTAHDLRKIGYGGMIEVIPNGLELTKYDNYSLFQEYLPYILFLGRLVDYKNLNVLIDAFAETSKVLPEVMLIITGDGPMRKKWIKQAKDLGIVSKVQFTGYISEPAKLDLISKCSALALPSTMEGFGMTVIEAFAMSKPVIVSDIESLKELVQDGVDGFVVSPLNPFEWATKFGLLLSDASLCREMGTRGRNKIAKEYQIEKVGELLEALYGQVVSKENITVTNVKPRLG